STKSRILNTFDPASPPSLLEISRASDAGAALSPASRSRSSSQDRRRTTSQYPRRSCSIADGAAHRPLPELPLVDRENHRPAPSVRAEGCGGTHGGPTSGRRRKLIGEKVVRKSIDVLESVHERHDIAVLHVHVE